MAILFCGGEAEDVQTVGAVSFSTAASWFRSAYARGAIAVTGNAANFVNYATASFAASSVFSVTCRMGTNGSSMAAGMAFLSLAIGGIRRLRLRVTGSAPSTIILDKHDGTTATTLATSSATIAVNSSYRLDVIVDYQTSGRVRVFLDGASIIDYSGDVTTSAATALDTLWLGALGGAATFCHFSEIIVADEDTRPLSLKTLVPNATGDVTGWTGGTWADIDEPTASDTDVASSATAGQVLNMECTGMPSGSSGLSVRAVKVVASALRGASGPSKLALGVKSGATEGWSIDKTLDTGYTAVSHTWATNPATGAAFTASELESLKLALKSVA